MKYHVMSYSIHTIFQCLTLVYHLRVISADFSLTLLDININITFQSLHLNLSKVENLTAHILYPAYDRKLLSLCLIDCLYIIKFVITSLFWKETGKGEMHEVYDQNKNHIQELYKAYNICHKSCGNGSYIFSVLGPN